MTRPPEYENLIRMKAFEAVAPTPGAVAGFLRNAQDYLETAQAMDPARALQVFTLAYEGYFQVVQAVLEFFQVRTKDAGRNLAIQRVSADLHFEPKEIEFVIKAHARRNGTSYTSPFPPVSKAEATTLVNLLAKYLPRAHSLTGQPDV
jgi:hypothetical protein